MKNSNYIYIIFNIFLIISIICLNYFTDPYFVLKKNRPININRYLLDDPYLAIKMQDKNKKFKYLITGGSTTNAINLSNFNKEIMDISCFKIKTEDMTKLLFNYLDIHPEIKTVFLPLDYRQIADTARHKIPDFDEKKLTTKDYIRLFLSIDATKHSLIKLIHRIPQYPIRLVKYKVQDIDLEPDEIKKIVIENYEIIFSELEKRNIKVICYIPPVHTIRLNFLYDKIGFETLLEIEKYLIDKNNYLIDMSTVNKFTTLPLKDSYPLFSDVIHPSNIYGYYIYNILFDTNKKDKDLYKILTKNNVEKEEKIKYEKVKIHIEKNKEEYKYYLVGDEPYNLKKLRKNLNDIPEEFRHILHYKKSIFYKN